MQERTVRALYWDEEPATKPVIRATYFVHKGQGWLPYGEHDSELLEVRPSRRLWQRRRRRRRRQRGPCCQFVVDDVDALEVTCLVASSLCRLRVVAVDVGQPKATCLIVLSMRRLEQRCLPEERALIYLAWGSRVLFVTCSLTEVFVDACVGADLPSAVLSAPSLLFLIPDFTLLLLLFLCPCRFDIASQTTYSAAKVQLRSSTCDEVEIPLSDGENKVLHASEKYGSGTEGWACICIGLR